MGTVLSILVLAAIVLLIGAIAMWRRGAPLRKVMLMVLLAAIAVVNVAIWTLPDASGLAPASKQLEPARPGSAR